MTDSAAYAQSVAAILACRQVDVAIVSSVPVTPALDNLEPDPQRRHRENLYAAESQPRLLVDALATSAKPAVVVIDSGRLYDPMAVMVERAGIPVFRKIDRAARALATFCRSA
jgi:acyl-CoA synthetase (NDP forming)